MRTLLFGIVTLLVATPALATECPEIWQQINAKMKTVTLPAQDQAKLVDLRKQGEDFHHAGNHSKAVAMFKQALALYD
jgi:hypothetical protein